MNREQLTQCRRYVDRIRNREKQRYAVAYFNFRKGFFHEPNPADFGLTYMAAQSVRMQLTDILEGRNAT